MRSVIIVLSGIALFCAGCNSATTAPAKDSADAPSARQAPTTPPADTNPAKKKEASSTGSDLGNVSDFDVQPSNSASAKR